MEPSSLAKAINLEHFTSKHMPHLHGVLGFLGAINNHAMNGLSMSEANDLDEDLLSLYLARPDISMREKMATLEALKKAQQCKSLASSSAAFTAEDDAPAASSAAPFVVRSRPKGGCTVCNGQHSVTKCPHIIGDRDRASSAAATAATAAPRNSAAAPRNSAATRSNSAAATAVAPSGPPKKPTWATVAAATSRKH